MVSIKWVIWISRNLVIFQNSVFNPPSILKEVERFMESIQKIWNNHQLSRSSYVKKSQKTARPNHQYNRVSVFDYCSYYACVSNVSSVWNIRNQRFGVGIVI